MRRDVSPVMLIRGARRLLTDGNAWAKQRYAESGDGGEVEANDPSATCWCVLGALHRVSGDTTMTSEEFTSVHVSMQAQVYISAGIPWEIGRRNVGGIVADWQDRHRTRHAEVLAVLDDAEYLARLALARALVPR